MPCPHLIGFQAQLHAHGIRELRREQPFCGWDEWLFFDCRFDFKSLKRRKQLAPCLHFHSKILSCWPVQAIECTVCGVAIAGILRDGEQVMVG